MHVLEEEGGREGASGEEGVEGEVKGVGEWDGEETIWEMERVVDTRGRDRDREGEGSG